MADFSQFAAPSREWLDYARQNPLHASPGLGTVAEIRAFCSLVNAGRLRASQLELEKMTDHHVTMTNVSISTTDNQSILVRIYRSLSANGSSTTSPVIIYYHGGGFLTGTLDTEDAMCVRIVQNTPFIVISVDYRHTPDWTCPTQINDAWDARSWVLEHATDYGGDV